ncbi:metal-sensing transcriptional repressor [Oscillospiraceae bacterium MB08-C2-2]|nr:metal-sensing transcriptional repressor [Oscillospiraceae bacterium MB08-C2-2]
MNTEQKKAITALKTCRGQIEGIIAMIEEGRYCIDISNQIMASQAVLKRANKLILAQHMSHCVLSAMQNEDQAQHKLEEIQEIINKLL